MKLIAIILLIATIVTTARADNCFKFYLQPPKPLPVKFIERSAGNARTFEELISRSPRQPRFVSAYRTARIPAEVTWGTLGWEKSVLAYRTPRHKALARKFVQGVEVSSLDNERLETGDIDYHWQFAREMQCLNRKAGKVVNYSFGETVKLKGR